MVVAKKATRNVTKITAGSFPGKIKMATGTQARGGIGLKRPRSAEAYSLTLMRHPIKIPSGTPSRTAKQKEVVAR